MADKELRYPPCRFEEAVQLWGTPAFSEYMDVGKKSRTDWSEEKLPSSHEAIGLLVLSGLNSAAVAALLDLNNRYVKVVITRSCWPNNLLDVGSWDAVKNKMLRLVRAGYSGDEVATMLRISPHRMPSYSTLRKWADAYLYDSDGRQGEDSPEVPRGADDR